MGISTRKAGTVVKCPKCAGEIIVPSPDEPQASDEPAPQPMEPAADQPAPAPAALAGAFEEKDFEAYFNEAANGSVGTVRTETAPAEPVPESAVVPPPSPPPPPPPPSRRGIFLTIGALIFSVIVIILLLVLVFVLGIVIGRHTAPRDSASGAARFSHPD
jgi:hypothetical protein